MSMMSGEAFKRAAQSALGKTGLTLLVIGALAGCAAGVVIGMLELGSPSDRPLLKWLLLGLATGAISAAVIGNYLWYRARLADRSPT